MIDSWRKPQSWHRRFAVRLVLLVTTLLVTAISLHGWYTLHQQTRLAEGAARNTAERLARDLTMSVRSPLFDNNLAGIEELLRLSAEHPEVLRLRVTDRDGQVVGHVARLLGQASVQAVYRPERLVPAEATAGLHWHRDRLEVREPVSNQGLVGWVVLEYSLATLSANRIAIVRNTLLAIVVGVSVSLLLIMLFLRRPLQALAEAGRFAARLDADRGSRLSLGRVPAEIEQLGDALNQASQQLESSHRQVVHSARRLQEILNQAGDAILTLAPGGGIQSANTAARHMLDLSPDDLTGKPLLDCLRLQPEARAEVEDEIEAVERGEEHPAFEFEGVTADGRYFIVEALARRLIFEDEQAGIQLTLREITERKRLEQLAGRLGRILEQSANEIYVVDVRSFRYLQASDGARHNLGYSVGELAGMTPLDLLPALTAAHFDAMVEPLFDGRQELVVFDSEQRRRDGTHYPVQMRWQLSRNESPPVLLAIVEDLTERKHAEAVTARLGRMLDRSSNEIYVFDAQTLRFIQVNEGACRNLGYSAEELRQLTAVDIKPDYTRDSFEETIAPLRGGDQDNLTFVTQHRRKDGSLYPVEVQLQLSRSEIPPVFVAMVQDISERKQSEERLSFMANFDSLTGLSNRVLLGEKLQQALLEAKRHQRRVAVLFLDLDRFKNVNDSLGHEAGDALLKVVADRLQATVRHGDTVARLGGDEFVVVLADVAHIDDIARVARKILQHLGEPLILQGREMNVTSSIGIAVYPDEDQSAEALLKYADIAMYHAKESGRNNYQFYTAELNQRLERRLAVEDSLRHALERGELSLHYQPQADLADGRITGLEALLRWQHPRWGMVSPLEFIPIAEETGMIVPIGAWVLAQACADARALDSAGLGSLRMAVNLSSRQFEDARLLESVAHALADSGLPADRLEVEITESLLMRNIDDSARLLRELAHMGVSISMDDFGTGYSSLAYLKRLPIDVVKIDRSFVLDITTNPDDAAIARTIILLAHSLGLRAVAEGVETDAQLEFLHRHECDAIQGYWLAKPMSLAALKEWLPVNPRLERSVVTRLRPAG